MRMDSQAPLPIHEVLPGEIMAIIFEEHAKLKWRAPAIDGRVCRLWRQIVLNAPRAWTYLEFGSLRLRISGLLLWLDRSRTAPLHITIGRFFTLKFDANNRRLYESLYTRIASLRMFQNCYSFFDGRHFPCMQHLEVVGNHWSRFHSLSVWFGHMPKLRSLRLGRLPHVASLDGLSPLKVLALSNGTFTSLSQHSSSLISLTLHDVKLGDAISGSMDFPSLTYLSLHRMSDLKPHINAPRLVTYHEFSANAHKSFSAPLHSLVEYGLLALHHYIPDLTEWHNSFPNISRLSIRAGPPSLKSILESLSIHPHLLPSLQMISIAHSRDFTKEEQGAMEDLVRVRSEACHLDVALYFETKQRFHIPLFFGGVSL